ncbi:MAG TPA: DUF1028 domain-containing protein [Candidatus Limnocylindrales bacterium]|nr:DUF1028 domain-containing protein [Candidatus Limnocylindrales bacterium]
MTFSIVARDPETGDFGVAVASKFLAAGSVVSHASAGVGAIATQALANYSYGRDGLDFLADGRSAQEAIDALTAADDGREQRQLGIVDAHGRAATYTGRECIDWAGGLTADGVAVQGNILAGSRVVDAMLAAYLTPGRPFPERLVDALIAADAEGGDRRGRQSAAVLVKREKGGYGGNNDVYIDLRVDDDASPMQRLAGMLDLVHLYRDRPKPADLLPIDEALVQELQSRLTAAGHAPTTLPKDGGLAKVLADTVTERTGEPREMPVAWDESWEAVMAEWISTENLEERMTARGWIDPKVLEYLRKVSAG